MNHPLNEQLLLRALKGIRLSAADKAAHTQALYAEMNTNPLPAGAQLEGVRNTGIARHLSRRKILTRHNKLFTRMPIAILIALLMGGGVSFAAADTVPGDALYPVKIHVNENVESAFTLGDSANAKLEVNLALRRLNEAEKLESEKKLNAETKAELKSNFDKHTTRVETKLADIKKHKQSDADEIASEFETSLSGHVSALGLLGVHVSQQDAAEAESKQDDTQIEGSSTERMHATSTTKQRHGNTFINAVFRANNDLDEEEGNASSSSTHVESLDTRDDSEGDKGGSSDKGNHSGAVNTSTDKSGTVKVGDGIEVNTSIKSRSTIEAGHGSGDGDKTEIQNKIEGSDKLKIGL